MKLRSVISRIVQHEDLNFLLTNRIPRRWLTLFLGWFSKLEHPLIRDGSLLVWRLFSDLDLSEARQIRFKSLHDCFTRELKEGARPIDHDPATLVSPCDAIVGAYGTITDGCLLQAKGFPYTLQSLLGVSRPELVSEYLGGSYVTLRLKSSMYHRFHAPYDCRVEQVTYISGDTWNVNPIALERIEQLFCKNERAVMRCRLPSGQVLTLVPVAAILVASIRLHCLDVLLHLKYRGPRTSACDAMYRKGEEMGWFQHGSTIIVLAPPGLALRRELSQGQLIRMGQPLLSL
ncbi:MAG TPA: archaetidylserine decarboxylase [Steroidobacteraceae bacterium]